MKILLCYVIIYLVEALILWLYCNDLFIPKYTVRRTALTLFVLYSLLFGLSMLNIYPLNAVAFLVASFLFIYFLYDTKLTSALFHTGVITISMSFGELISLSLFPDFARNFYEARSDISQLLVCVFLNKLIYFFIVYVLSHIPAVFPKPGRLGSKISFTDPDKQNNSPHNKKTTGSRGALALVPIPLVTFFVMLTLYIIYFTADISVALNRMIAACSVLLLMLNLLIWFFFSYTQKRNQDFIDLQLSLLRENDATEYYKMLSVQTENRNILVHDIRGHFYAILALAERNHQQEIVDYINNLMQTSSLQNTDILQFCNNETLNAILCRYHENCKKQGIDFRTDIRDGNINFMTANDLTVLFCNLLDNAVEAASCVPDAFIELNISRQSNAPYTILSVTNSCPQNPFDAHGKLPSHKKDKSQHGLGLKSIRRSMANYGGDMQLFYEENTKTFHVVMQVRVLGD